jgi:hypothetical protein
MPKAAEHLVAAVGEAEGDELGAVGIAGACVCRLTSRVEAEPRDEPRGGRHRSQPQREEQGRLAEHRATFEQIGVDLVVGPGQVAGERPLEPAEGRHQEMEMKVDAQPIAEVGVLVQRRVEDRLRFRVLGAEHQRVGEHGRDLRALLAGPGKPVDLAQDRDPVLVVAAQQGEAELPLDGDPLCWRRWLVQRAAEVPGAGRRCPAAGRRGSGLAELVHGPCVARRLGEQEMRGDRVEVGAVAIEQPGRSRVRRSSHALAHVGEHRFANEGMGEGRHRPIREQGGRDQPGDGLGHPLDGVAAEQGDQADLGAWLEDRHRSGDVGLKPSEPREATEDRAGRARCRQPRQALWALLCRVDLLVGQRPEQLGQQERVAARRRPAGAGEPVARGPSRLVGRHRGDRGHAERLRCDQPGERLAAQRVDGSERLLVLTGPDRHRQCGGRVRQPAADVEEGLQRRGVGPLGVVDRDHQRRGLGQLCHQPVETMLDAEGVPVAGVFEGGRGHRGAAGQPGAARAAVEHRLEELAHDAIGKLALILAAPRPQHPGTERLRAAQTLLQQDRLARSGLAFDEQQAAFACRCATQRRLDRGQLRLSL